jgi:hypothetical protein
MTRQKLFSLAALLASFLVLTRTVPAQDSAAYYVEPGAQGPHFIQRLSWEPEEYASRYELRIEKQEAGNWIPALAEFTRDHLVEFSLPPGIYRYRIQAYDLLDKPAGNPQWFFFEILPALQPELVSFAPTKLSLGRDSGQAGDAEQAGDAGDAALTITVRGRRLDGAAEFRLVSERGEEFLPLESRVEAGGERAVVVFSKEQLGPGTYGLHIVNPGGLSDSLGSLRVYKSGERTWNLSAGYSPLVPLYGELHELLSNRIFPLGLYGRLAVFPAKNAGTFNPGLEGTLYWTSLSSRYEDGIQSYDVQGRMLNVGLYGLLQKALGRSLFLSVRLGGEVAYILDFEKQALGLSAGKINALIPAAAGGVSIRKIFSSSLFAELGVDYLRCFSVDNPSPAYLRPFLGAGVSW